MLWGTRLSGLAAALTGLTVLALAPAPAQEGPAPAGGTALYRDASAPIERRVEDLLGRMTLEEKVAQVITLLTSKAEVMDGAARFDPERASQAYPNGIGQIARPSDRQAATGATGTVIAGRWHEPAEATRFANEAQRWAMTRTRLGIPILFHEESLHGSMAPGTTMFPQAIALASSWDPDLVRRVNAVIAREVRARGVPFVLSPVVDIVRDPRWGRIEETFGEDPWLVSEMGVASVLGLQGELDGGRLGPGRVFATLKHMTGHGQPQGGNNVAPAPISERELREYFFPPFEAAIRRARPAAVMASYNEIDGVPSHANRWLLQDVLRGEWGFDGVLVSDYSAIEELATFHHVEPDLASAAIRALEAGVDSDLPDGRAFRTLVESVRAGRVGEDVLDGAVRRILDLKFRAGLFENPYADPAAEAVIDNDEARALALEAARRSVVLLRNDGLLPLGVGAHRRIAVIGPNAAVARLGGYSGHPRHRVSLLDGIRARVGDRAEVVHAQGVFITRSEDRSAHEVLLADPARNRELIAEADEAARGADLLVLAIGDTEQTSREGFARNHLGDRTSLDLVGEQNDLAAALFVLGKPVVVALNGRPPSWPAVVERADALVEAWYVGQEGGTALAEILFGDVNPGGKLPVTVARHVGQIPLYYNHKPSALRGYLFDSTAPLFPFGFGLSYTSFEISEPRLSAARIRPDGTVRVAVDVRNSGRRAGDEVVQLYVRDKVSSVTRPVLELRGFERITLRPGERRTVEFELGPQSFRFWDARMQRVVEPGEFDILVGNSSADLRSTTLTIAP